MESSQMRQPKDAATVINNQQSSFESSTDSSAPDIPNVPVQRVVVIDKYRVVGISEDDESFYHSFSKLQRRRVRVKTDLRLLPVLCILYLFAQLDRANIANAKIEGLKEDTHMTDQQYNLVLAVFFLPYFLLEVPSNIVLKTLKRPSLYISFLVCSWGIIMTCHGFVEDFKGMLIVRLLLGAFESGFFPAATYICSQWYRPHELAFRLSLFMAVASASGVFSGLMAAAIAKMGGLGGYESWRWIFLVEGGVTILLGFLTFFFLMDTPKRSAKWLEPEEIRYLEILSFIKEGGRSTQSKGPSKWQDFLSIVKDWRYWAFGILFHNVGACGYGLKFAVPSIIKGLGYSRTKSQLLSAIPYIFGIISALSVSFCSDMTASRAYFVAGGLSSILLGFSIILSVVYTMENRAPGVIIGMSFVTSGVFPMAPVGGSWASNNFGTSSRRAIGLAFVMAIGSLGGLTGSFIYKESQSPYFHLAFSLSIGFAFLGLGIVAALTLSYWFANRSRGRLVEEEVRRQYTEVQLVEMGEKSPLFRYTL